jgi:hypothetical protein
MRYDFSYVQAVQAKARRERAEAMHEMLIAPLVALIKPGRNRGLTPISGLRMRASPGSTHVQGRPVKG